MDERIFTLAEAQSLLPRLRTLLAEIGEEWNHVRQLNPDIQKARDKAQFDGRRCVCEGFAQHLAVVRVVLGHQDQRGGLAGGHGVSAPSGVAAGRWMENTDPTPGVDCTSMRPPWRSTIFLTMASPMPEPS